jgi:tetratricopeptide (TPR) repeat protein
MFRLWAIITAILVISNQPTRATPPTNNLLVVGVTEFAAAYEAWDGARFAKAAELFRHSFTNADVTITNHYWLGVAQFHWLLQLQHAPGAATNQVAIAGVLDAAVETFSKAVKLDPKHAEIHALLGTLYGMKINDSFMRAVRFGPRVAKHRDLALSLGPQNPRVRYLLGMCLFHTSSKAKDWRETLAALQAAEKLFETEAKRANSALDPRWGYSNCLTFIGRTYEKLGDSDQAADYYRRALGEHPADHIARAGLERVTEKK